jgi:DNA-binding response OmpR family regulator
VNETLAEERPLALILEDDEALASGYAVALDEAGYDTSIFRDGQTALDSMAVAIPALMILDLNLPTISGEDILRNVKADKRFARTKIVIVSANSTWGSHLEDEVTIVLTKPVGFRLLRDLAIRLIG